MMVRPFRAKRMNRRMTLLLIEELKKAPVAPMERLNKDAKWLEKEILRRRSNNYTCQH